MRGCFMVYTRLCVIILLQLLFVTQSCCQKETNNWFFGYSVGLNFNNRNPLPLSGSSLKAVEGSAVISDNLSGDLLFYTDGRTFWNANHQLMPSSETLTTT